VSAPLTVQEQRNVIFHDAYDAYLSLHEDWDRVDLHMSGDLLQIHAELREMLDGIRPMNREEEELLGDLAKAWRTLPRD
jgi:hypothetical protein